jgi:hypothetical protein
MHLIAGAPFVPGSDSSADWISLESSSVRSFSLRPDGEVALFGEEFDFRRWVPVTWVPPCPGSIITVNSSEADAPNNRILERRSESRNKRITKALI